MGGLRKEGYKNGRGGRQVGEKAVDRERWKGVIAGTVQQYVN